MALAAETATELVTRVANSSYDDLLERKGEIAERLAAIEIHEQAPAPKRKLPKKGAPPKKQQRQTKNASSVQAQAAAPAVDVASQPSPGPPLIPQITKTDTHWDFVMKEMMWLGVDFSAERKRQLSLAKKLAGGVRQYHKTKESRKLKELQEAELKRRKLAARLARECKGWWTKVERVVTYKQKLHADDQRQKAMNKQLVALVKQTERYSESLSRVKDYSEEDDDDESDSVNHDDHDNENSGMDDNHGPKQRLTRRKRNHRRKLTIEEALALEYKLASRKSKARVTDYSRMRLPKGDDSLYGESIISTTASENDNSGVNSDESYCPESASDDADDETTMREAEHVELEERKKVAGGAIIMEEDTVGDSNSNQERSEESFIADPEELKKLQEEADMEIDQVIERLQREGKASHQEGIGTRRSKRVKFAGSAEASDNDNAGLENDPTPSPQDKEQPHKPIITKHTADPGNDADDDGDASDVEDFVAMEVDDNPSDNDDNGSGSEEFQADEQEVDDETTIIQEEQLPQELSVQQEIDLLKKESEVSVEELRAIHAKMEEHSNSQHSSEDGQVQQQDEPEDPKVEDALANSEIKTETLTEDVPEKTQEIPDKTQESTGYESSLKDINEDVQDADDDEFNPNVTEVDDETTMEAEEKLGREMTYEQEIAMLKREGEMSVEELRAIYAAMDDEDVDDDEDDDDSVPERSEEQEKKESLVDALAAALDGDIEDGGEFQPNEGEGVDDETTLAAEEKLGRDMSYDEEIAMLKRESEMSVEELKAMYASMQDDSGSEAVTDDPASTDDEKRESFADMLASAGDGDAEDYQPDDAEAVDDETTFEAEERLGRDMPYNEELALLKKESEMSVEELRAMYAGAESDDDVEQSESTEMDVEKGRQSAGKRKRESDDDSDGDAEKTPQEPETETSDDGLAALNALEASAERARQTLATRPYLLASWVKMREYQQIGLNWLVSLQSRRLNGILADEMGLGKTLQTISLFSYLASYKGIWGPHLVVVPTSVIINWETELKRFCPALKVLTYYGSAKRRKELRTGWTKSNWYHVVITSYQLAVQDAFAFKRKRWYYLVLDEAQNIKNFQSQRWQTLINFNTQRRLLLTGTPLQNNLMELWSLLHFLMPYIFRSRKEFSYWFSNPMNNMIEGNSDRNEDVISRLHGIIRPFVLRRLKKDVETQMPGKYEHVVKCQLSRRQMSLYEEFLSRSSTRHALKKGGNFMGMMTVLMQLRKVCNHPDLFEPRSVVTPFVVPSLSVPMASCVFDALKDGPVIERLSVNLIQPLWCGSSGLPSIEVSLRHDIIESRQLQAFDASGQMNTSFPSESKEEEDCPKELRPLFEEIQELHCRAHLEKSQFHQKLNAWRCQSPAFPYSTRFLETVEVRDAALYRQDPVEVDRRKVVLTPASLLEMRMTEQQRADDMDEVFDKFVFCVPRAGARRPKFDTKATNIPSDQLGEMLLEPLEELMKPSRKVDARLSSFFPDKKLIQFDSGKLQTLAELLHKLKRGGHRALIFTQMGKMLDILEAFLNINGHTYLRLDGSTGIERRQRYMDRFNNDTKIFCFILSTRSGGTGVNLTGADTVIFYDSDWNPAMDAQAQDRAHRIGQTRDVHIYRLITEHTIEENILIKAKQKRNLDIMVMDQGKFDASQPSSKRESQSQENDAQDVYTKGGLRAILGVSDNDDDGTSQILEGGEAEAKDPSDLNKEQMEIAMTALEDDDDVKALRGAQKEAAEELQEFDENAEIKKDSDAEDDDAEMDENEYSKTQTQDKGVAKEDTGADQKKEESELEKEFEAWQTSVGLDASTIEASLSPMERYGLNFREEIDPFYSIFSVQEYRRKMEATEIEDDIDVDEIDREKAMEERRAMDEGDLLATRPRPEDLIRQRNLYKRERARLRADKMRRKLTGENWSSKIDGQTKNPFWYNSDTGEAIWDKPVALIDLEAEEKAHQQGWNALPLKPLVHVMEFLIPYPERTCCSAVCRQWRMAAHNVKFVRHVYPVEMGALAREESRREYNHYSTIAEALSIALPGDTIELADGHYWVNEPGLHIDMPIRIVGDESNAANVVLEMSGSLRWAAKGGWIEGVTFRRPKISSGTPPSVEMLSLEGDGRVDIISSVFDNEGSTGAVTTVAGTGIKGRWYNVSLRGGGRDGVAVNVDGSLELVKCSVRANGGDGLKCTKGKISLIECRVEKNHGNGVTLSGASSGEILRCHFSGNDGGIVHKESGCVTTCSGNTASVTLQPPKNIPGFRVTMIGSGGGVIPARPTTVASSG